MTFRRFVALLLLVACAGLWHLGRHDLAGTILGPVSQLVAFFVGLPALIAFIFNLRVANREQPAGAFEDASTERRGHQIGLIALFVFGAMPIFIGARALYTGVMPALGHGPDFVFREAPLAWLGTLAVFFGGGSAVLWLAWQVARVTPRSDRGDRDPPAR